MRLSHLQRLEAESIFIFREVVAEAEKPVMLYSVGKDSSVMVHLALKAFHPGKPPFPLLHVDTTWKFRDMYAMRARMAKEMGMELLVYQNPEAKERGINPFDHGALHTDMWKTEGLKQALDLHGFDAAFGGARRDEEKSRAKERIFSFRTASHGWDPKNQRPELWNLYNAKKAKGESIRIFPISNWTELDIWQYIQLNDVPIVPLYFAAPRPTVERDPATYGPKLEQYRRIVTAAAQRWDSSQSDDEVVVMATFLRAINELFNRVPSIKPAMFASHTAGSSRSGVAWSAAGSST